MNDVEALLARLVAIDSTSSRPNAPMLDALEPVLQSLGFTTRRVGYVDDAGVPKANLLATLGHGTAELALVGHTDCVPFDPAWKEALTLTERDGKLYGRGACDTKAFIACAVTAAARVKGQLQKPVLLAFTADEEVGCVGAKHLVKTRALDAKRAIVGEPTSLTPVRANKGYCLADLEVHGKEGHSAYPHTGASAVFRAARLLTRLETYSLGPLREQQDPAFEPPFTTLNVGLLQGGKAKNVIPGNVRATLEWRPIPAQGVEKVLHDALALRDACAAEEPGFRAEVRPLRMDRGFDTSPQADVVRFLEGQSGKVPITVAFGTEGPQLAELGAVPVVFGPGDIKNAHQTGEFVPTAELHRCVEVLEAALRHFCG
ncbi:MAG: acetylornithine deacetylase [Myxococcaceae bacterium]|nr:acetylornithine deacetylase [Myxococcaceae bacterium]